MGGTIRVLGPVEARGPEGVANLGGPLATALLCLLAIHEQPVAPDVLADELWAGEPPATASSALRMHVSRLRAAMRAVVGEDHDPVLRTGVGYRLDRAHWTVDREAFLVAVGGARNPDAPDREAALLDALVSWRGDPFDGATGLPALAGESARLEEGFVEGHLQLAEHRLAGGRASAAVADLQMVVTRRPLEERPVTLLMRALYADGRQADALRAFDALRTRLVEDVGITPGAEATDLRDAILRQALPPPIARKDESRSVPALRRGHRAPMVGRTEELGRIVALLDAPRDEPVVVLVTGTAGIGKTRLLAALAERPSGHRLLHGWADHHQTSLGVLRTAIEQLVATAGESGGPKVISRLVTTLRSGSPTEDLASGRARLVEDLVDAMAALHADAGLELLLDDGQWIDEDSRAVLRAVVRHPRCPPLGVVMTERVAPGERGSSAVRLAAALTPVAELHEVALLPLADDDMRLLVHSVPAERSKAEEDRLIELAGGVPFFGLQLARAGEALPSSVVSSIEDQIEGLDRDIRRAVEPLAVLGDHFSVALASRVLDLDRRTTVGLLDEAARSHLFSERGDGEFQWEHALLRELVLGDMTAAKRAEHHLDVWRALQEETGPAAAAGVATHGLAAAHLLPDEELLPSLVAAAEVLASGLALERASTVAQAVLERATEGSQWAWRAAVVMGRATSPADEDEGRSWFRQAMQHARRADRPDWVATTALARLGRDLWLDHELLDNLEHALARCHPGDDVTRASLLTRLATESCEYEDPGRPQQWAAEAVACARRSGDPLRLAHALHAVQTCDRVRCPPEERHEIAQQISTIGAQVGDVGLELMGRVYGSVDLLEADRVDEAEAVLEETVRDAEQAGWSRWHAYALNILGVIALHRGDVERWDRLAQEANHIGNAAAVRDADGIRSAGLLCHVWHHGDLATIAPLAAPMVEQYPDSPIWPCVWAVALAEAGDDLAAGALAALDETTLPHGMVHMACLVFMARAAVKLGARDRYPGLRAALEPLSGRLVVAGIGTGIYGAVDNVLASLD